MHRTYRTVGDNDDVYLAVIFVSRLGLQRTLRLQISIKLL